MDKGRSTFCLPAALHMWANYRLACQARRVLSTCRVSCAIASLVGPPTCEVLPGCRTIHSGSQQHPPAHSLQHLRVGQHTVSSTVSSSVGRCADW